jgi:methylenetetrahydrofolate dehydrogenase (NADP+)/methenyltetrahydrofolate cyclohydrolase
MTSSAEPRGVVMLGKPVADAIEARLQGIVPELRARTGLVPRLAIVLVGDNPASERYVRKKIDACGRLGMRADMHRYAGDITADDLKAEVLRLSGDAQVHGIIVQLPLPGPIEEHDTSATNKFDVFDAIAPDKDVDGVGRDAVAALYRASQGHLRLLPGTALAVRRMMAFYGVETYGRLAVVVGRNDITSKPILHMLGGRMCNAAAIWVHRHVPPAEQRRLIGQADILVTAVGTASYRITADMVKPGVAVFDVATRVDAEGKLHGDVDFNAVRAVASHITPVPRGIGPVTVAALCENLVRATEFAAGVGKPGYAF